MARTLDEINNRKALFLDALEIVERICEKLPPEPYTSSYPNESTPVWIRVPFTSTSAAEQVISMTKDLVDWLVEDDR